MRDKELLSQLVNLNAKITFVERSLEELGRKVKDNHAEIGLVKIGERCLENQVKQLRERIEKLEANPPGEFIQFKVARLSQKVDEIEDKFINRLSSRLQGVYEEIDRLHELTAENTYTQVSGKQSKPCPLCGSKTEEYESAYNSNFKVYICKTCNVYFRE